LPLIVSCHSEVFGGIWPDPSEDLGVTGANGITIRERG
jgi:hypothetical protein